MALNICLVQEGDQHFTCLAVGFLLGRSRYADRRGPAAQPEGEPPKRSGKSLLQVCGYDYQVGLCPHSQQAVASVVVLEMARRGAEP
jgi:hypothetical protein